VKLYGGSRLANTTCTIFPKGFPGHTSFCGYTKGGGSKYNGPDIAKAKALVAASGTKGAVVKLVATNDAVNASVAQYIVSVLNQIGYKASVVLQSANIQFNYIQNTNNKVQISLTQWFQDYPAASDFINILLGCSTFHPGSDNSINIAGFCNSGVDTQIKAAETLSITNPTAANVKWGQIDKNLMTNFAPWVPLINPKLTDFVSSRVGNYKFSLEFYMYVDQLWVK